MARPLAQSATKREFLSRLNLAEGDPEAERIHRKMMEEAKGGRERLAHDPQSIAPYNQHDPEVIQPYGWTYIMETAKHREILALHRNASTETRTYYDKGYYTDGVNAENWVIQWLLWHSFRSYRTRPGSGREEEGEEQSITASSTYSPPRGPSTRTSSQSTTSVLESSQAPTPPRGPRHGYWDPVRDV